MFVYAIPQYCHCVYSGHAALNASLDSVRCVMQLTSTCMSTCMVICVVCHMLRACCTQYEPCWCSIRSLPALSTAGGHVGVSRRICCCLSGKASIAHLLKGLQSSLPAYIAPWHEHLPHCLFQLQSSLHSMLTASLL